MSPDYTVHQIRPSVDGDLPVDGLALIRGACTVERLCPDPPYNHGDFVHQPEAWLTLLQGSPRVERLLFVAVRGADVIGYAAAELPLVDNLHVVESVEVRVLPEARRQGVGTALLDAIASASTGRTHRMAWSGSTLAEPGEAGALASRSDPLTARRTVGTDFALSHGFLVAQIERYSVLELPDAPEPPSPTPGYRLTTWRGVTPAELAASYAALLHSFETDHPQGDAEREPESWDAEGLIASEAVGAASFDRLTSVAFDEASGEMIAATRLVRQRHREASAEQGVTVVRADHRGHGLGLALKRANLVGARAAWPKLRRVHTWNAGENDHMWRINAELGFVERGVEVCWQRVG